MRRMKLCADCNSNNVIKNLNTNKIYCFDCKSEKIYKTCYECGEPIKDEIPDGLGGWHDNNKIHRDNIMSCWDYHKLNELIDEECS